MVIANQELENFLESARVIASKLEERLEGTTFKFQVPQTGSIELTDGLRTDLAVIPKGPNLEIWLDDYFIEGNRQFYVCLFSSKSLQSYVERISRRLGEVIHIDNSKITTTEPYRLRNPLTSAAPFLAYEKYDGEEYLGLCDVATTDDGMPSEAFMDRVVTFVESMVEGRRKGASKNPRE